MDTKSFETDIFSQFNRKWALLTAGTAENYNTMTISWGGLGTIWGRSVATVYVRHSRYTFDYMNDSEYFTVSFYPEEKRQDLALLGRVSGRDGDKVAQTSLTPVEVPHGMSFQEAEVTLVCRKLYWQDLDPAHMPPEVLERNYADHDYHRLFIGEVVEILK